MRVTKKQFCGKLESQKTKKQRAKISKKKEVEIKRIFLMDF